MNRNFNSLHVIISLKIQHIVFNRNPTEKSGSSFYWCWSFSEKDNNNMFENPNHYPWHTRKNQDRQSEPSGKKLFPKKERRKDLLRVLTWVTSLKSHGVWVAYESKAFKLSRKAGDQRLVTANFAVVWGFYRQWAKGCDGM